MTILFFEYFGGQDFIFQNFKSFKYKYSIYLIRG